MSALQEVQIEEMGDLEPVGTKELDDDRMAAYQMLPVTIQTWYISV